MSKNLPTKKDKAINLRLEGKSYREIIKTLSISSKGTLNYWFRELKLSPEAKKRIKSNSKKSFEKGLARFNKERTAKIKKENWRIFKQSETEISNLSIRELMLIGTALYWGEGYKRQSKQTPYIAFGNTDRMMIQIFLRFVREILLIPEEKIKCKIQIHPNLKDNKAIDFWNKVTNIPKDRLRISYQTSRASRGLRPPNRQPYGTAEIRVAGRKDFFRIMGWIKGISNQT